MMIDAHIHLEKGKYTLEWVNEFVKQALKMDLDEINLLEHTHIFKEFSPLYYEMSRYNTYQHEWFLRKQNQARSISDYINFVKEMKKADFPIKVNFGLEVCYSPEHEADIRNIVSNLDLDFLVGSIHWIDGWAFSHLKQKWSESDVDVEYVYNRYYDLMLSLVNSGIFNGLAHPNSLSCFGVFPKGDFSDKYFELAVELKKRNMYIEESSGLMNTYNLPYLGMGKKMLHIMKQQGVRILTASDAHLPAIAGMHIKEMQDIISS